MAIFTVTSIIDIISSVLRIYSNATDAQRKIVEWRVSDAAKQYYSREENKKFYKSLLSGDTKICDAIRIEKQKKIEEALNKMKVESAVVFLCASLFVGGCGIFNPSIREIPANINENAVDVNALKTTDKTYQVCNPTVIKVDDGKKQTLSFDKNWYLVHADWLKKFNENQDALLSLLDSKKTSTNCLPKANSNLP